MLRKPLMFFKAIIILLLLGILVELLILVFRPMQNGPVEILKAYIFDKDVDTEKYYQETLLNSNEPEPFWTPDEKLNTENQPEVMAHAGILVDVNTGNILFEKEANEKRPIASLVKIMTAIVALEHKNLDEKIYINQTAAGVGENSMGLTEGEIYTLEELMYGLILNSGNDAAYAIAEGVAGNASRFIEWMNIKAKELGLADTYFADSSGLDDTAYSTPKDLVKLARYALKNPDFREIVETLEYETVDDKHKYVYLYNQTNLLSTYPGVKGVKTGYTEEAGLCLVTYAQIEDVEFVGVVLNSIDRKGDMILMLDHGFETLGITPEHNLL